RAAPPTFFSVTRSSWPKLSAVARNTATACAVTSGPIPSPGRIVMLTNIVHPLHGLTILQSCASVILRKKKSDGQDARRFEFSFAESIAGRLTPHTPQR